METVTLYIAVAVVVIKCICRLLNKLLCNVCNSACW